MIQTPFKLTKEETLASAAATLLLLRLHRSGIQSRELAKVCEKPQYGFTAAASWQPTGPRFVRITDIKAGSIDWDRVPYCQCSNPTPYALNEGDILIARSGSVGKSFLVSSVPEPAVFASYMIRLRASANLRPDYVYWCLQSQQFWQQIMSERRGSAMKNINGQMLAALRFPWPETPVQKAVVTFLNTFRKRLDGRKEGLPDLPPPLDEQRRIVACIEELSAKIEEARNLRQHAAETMHGLTYANTEKTYVRLSHDFGKHRLANVCLSITDGDHNTPTFSDTGIRFIFVGNVSSGRLHFENSKRVDVEYFKTLKPQRLPERGDILYSAVGATLGIPAIVDSDEPFCFQRHVAILKLDHGKVSSQFVWHMLRSRTVFEKAWSSTTGSAQPTVPLRAIRELQIPVPPLTEQSRIVAYLNNIQAKLDALKKLQESSAAELDALMPSILSKAFSGAL